MTRAELLQEAGVWRNVFTRLSQGAKDAYKFVKSTPRDIKRMRRAHKLLKNPKFAQKHFVAQALNKEMPQYVQHARKNLPKGLSAAKQAERMAHVNTLAKGINSRAAQLERHRAKWGMIRSAMVKRNAVRLGALGIGATAAAYGIRTYKLRKRQAQEKPKFRDYNVYPQHNFSTAPVQPENRLAYYGEQPPESGPPRVIEIEREQLINQIVETLLT